MNKFLNDDIHRRTISGELCIYCGEAADTREHFPPISVSTRGLFLPACLECNIIAGNKYAYDLEMRALIVKDGLKHKYKKVLKCPDWTEKDLSELGHNLKSGVLEWQIKKSKLSRRLAWNAIKYLISIDHNNYFVQFYAKIGIIIKLEKNKLRIIKS